MNNTIKHPWLLFLATTTGPFMVGVDYLAMSIAIDPIAKTLALSINTLQWFLSAFAIGQAGSLMVAGKLADICGKKNILTIGILLFICSSGIITISSDALTITVARLLQGISGGTMATAGLAILVQTYTPMERAPWISRMIALNGLGMALGPVVGGFFVLHFSWRTLFLVNIPIGIIGLLLAVYNVPQKANIHHKQKIDYCGFILLSLFLFLSTCVLSQGGLWGWSSNTTLGLTLASVVTFTSVMLCERRRQGWAVLNLSIYKINNFLPANIIGFITYFSCVAWILIFGIYLQKALKLTPLTSGILVSSLGAAIALASPHVAKMLRIYTAKTVISFGCFCAVVAFTGMALAPVYPPIWFLIIIFSLYGASFGIINASSIPAAMEFMPQEHVGIGAGSTFMMRWFGSAAGAAVAATLFAYGYHTAINRGADLANYHGLKVCLFTLLAISIAALLIAQLWLKSKTTSPHQE